MSDANTSPGVPLSDEEFVQLVGIANDMHRRNGVHDLLPKAVATIQAEREKVAMLVEVDDKNSAAILQYMDALSSAQARATTAEALCVELRGRVAELERELEVQDDRDFDGLRSAAQAAEGKQDGSAG